MYPNISKAFDRVWHDGLICKLKRCGVYGQLLSLIKDFKKNRKQRTVLNGQSSSWGDVSAGVPQGSNLGHACQKSLEHLGHFFIIRTSNHSYQVQMPPRPRNNVDFESYCPSIPAESRIVLTSRISDHKTTLFQGGEGEIAKQGKISGGVPRLLAGIVGLLFFLVYINDLTAGLKCNVKLFADDTSLFTIVQDSKTAASAMNHDLELTSKWVHDWRMSFNPDPQKQAVELRYSRKKLKSIIPKFYSTSTTHP